MRWSCEPAQSTEKHDATATIRKPQGPPSGVCPVCCGTAAIPGHGATGAVHQAGSREEGDTAAVGTALLADRDVCDRRRGERRRRPELAGRGSIGQSLALYSWA